ncbi:MAG: esterase-like activity of phytase family protein [Candidatus Hydrogenedentes bacterium]|nr:esterase-like activity of phytase family protein [Candidatus Hydrogenedentota bacterium]
MRNFSSAFLLLLAGVCTGWSQSHVKVPELELEVAYPLEGSESTEPSGLALSNGTLFCVSDKQDSCIYKIDIENGKASLEPAIWFELPNEGPEGLADFEGIACDTDGTFYLASEKMFRVLRVSSDGKDTRWITPDLRPAGEDAGLFHTEGANFEGIAQLDPTHFFLCAERQPRGIVAVDITSEPASTKAYKLDKATVPPHGIRVPDFTDLCYHDGVLYALERNAEIISTVEIQNENVSVKPWRSFHDTADRNELRYTNSRFGMAEGLAIDSNRVYVVLDNNQDARANDPNDKRPLLFIFRL